MLFIPSRVNAAAPRRRSTPSTTIASTPRRRGLNQREWAEYQQLIATVPWADCAVYPSAAGSHMVDQPEVLP